MMYERVISIVMVFPSSSPVIPNSIIKKLQYPLMFRWHSHMLSHKRDTFFFKYLFVKLYPINKLARNLYTPMENYAKKVN